MLTGPSDGETSRILQLRCEVSEDGELTVISCGQEAKLFRQERSGAGQTCSTSLHLQPGLDSGSEEEEEEEEEEQCDDTPSDISVTDLPFSDQSKGFCNCTIL